jgi:hypothetical protein
MYIKRYAITGFLFVILVGWYVYAFITQESMDLNLFGMALPSLSIALWVVLPLIFLILASIFHISFYSFMGNLQQRKYEKDYNKLIDAVVDAYLGKENRKNSYKTKRYELLGLVIDNAKIYPTFESSALLANEKVTKVLEAIDAVKKGEVVDLKKYSLSSNNPLVIQNNRNSHKKGEISCEDVLTHYIKYDPSFCQEMYVEFVEMAPWYAIEKYKQFLSKEALFKILERVNANENTLELSNETLLSLLSELDLDAKDYTAISNTLSAHMLPEQRIKLFEMLSEENEEAISAYLFTLFDLEMLAPADEILDNSQADEYLNFKSYRALKECNKHFNIKLFV